MKVFLQSLRGRLVILTAIAVLPVFGLVIHNYILQRHARAEAVRTEALRLAQLVARQQGQIVQEARILLMTLARLPAVRGSDLEACNSALESAGEQFQIYTALVLSDRDGGSLCSSVPIGRAIDSADRPWFQRALTEQAFVLGGYQMGRISGKPVLVAAYPIMDNSGKPGRVLAVSLDITWINALASQIDLPPGATVALIDGDGTVMARHPDPEVWVGREASAVPVIRMARAGEEGAAAGVGLDGVRRLFAFSPLRESPNRSYGHVLIGIPEEVAFSDVDRLFRRDLALLGVLLALSLTGTSMVSRGLILRKSDAILRLAGRLADGDTSARTGLRHGSDEFGQLATALDRMAARSEERHDALMKAGRRLQQYADIVKNIQIGLLIYQLDDDSDDRSLQLIGANPAGEKLLGISADDMIGKTIDQIFPDLRAQGTPRLFADVVRSGQAVAVDDLHYGDQRVTESWWAFQAFPLPDSCVGVGFENITERKKAEEERRSLELQLRQAQKMEAIGLLAGGVAHDFNNILTAIIGNAQLALEEVGPDSPAGKDLLQILQLSNRCSVLIRQLLTFSRRQPLKPAVINLNTIVENTSGMLRRVIGSSIRLKFVAGASEGHVLADAGQIEQVLVNLVVNARDAMPRGGDLTIETANVTLDEAYAATHLEAKPGQYLMLAVSDTGHGMNEDTLNRVFEPFFTTKEPGKGTGLGLATAYGIVKQHNGSIFVYSDVGKGTTFKIYLPRAEAEMEATGGASEEPAPRGSETILLVEDQEVVRTLVQRVLEGQGYTVLSASDADEGEELFAKNEGVSLLITDLVMPGRTGWQLYNALRAARSGLKVLYISGYTDTSVVRNGGVAEGDPFLQKPFTPSALVKKVRQILDSPQ